jgi:S1-C subfamily serine protease
MKPFSLFAARKLRVAPVLAFTLALMANAAWVSWAAASEEAGRAERERIAAALVEVYTHASTPDIGSPWQSIGVDRYHGSGVVIEGNRILTAAHVVAHQVEVSVKRQGTTRRHAARVAFSGDACDLAILEVEDESFFAGVAPVSLGELPRLGDRVTAYGFPLGGESISITAGIVSRLEIGVYSHSGEELLQAQVDAALNDGNSGGPIVAGGELVGIAAEVLQSAENVGYVVPVPVIEHFLKDVEDGRVDGFPSMGIDAQPIENKALQASLGLTDRDQGALIIRVDAGSTGAEVLAPGDVLLSVDGLPIGRDLTIGVPGLGRVAASYAVRRRQVGQKVKIELTRDGKRFDREVVLRSTRPLVPDTQHGRPSYLVYGGLVFQPLTRDFIELFEDPPSEMAELYLYSNVRTPERSQVVVLSRVLPAAVNRGYEEFEDQTIGEVEGRVPRDMADLVRLLEAADGEYVRIVTRQGGRIVLDRRRAVASGSRVLERYGIGHDRSEDLRGR